LNGQPADELRRPRAPAAGTGSVDGPDVEKAHRLFVSPQPGQLAKRARDFRARLLLRPPVKGVKRPPVESYEGKTPALGDHQARALLEAPDAVSLKGKRDRAILATWRHQRAPDPGFGRR
jgi:hypothetical protein